MGIGQFLRKLIGTEAADVPARALVECLEGRTLLSFSLYPSYCGPIVRGPVGTLVPSGTSGQGQFSLLSVSETGQTIALIAPQQSTGITLLPLSETVVADATITVAQPQQPTVVTLLPLPERVVAGESVTLAARVELADGGVPGIGYVSFFDISTGAVEINDAGQLVVGGASLLGQVEVQADGSTSVTLVPPAQRTVVFGGSLNQVPLLPGTRSIVVIYTESRPASLTCGATTLPLPQFKTSASTAQQMQVVMPTTLKLQSWGAATKTHAPVFTATVMDLTGLLLAANQTSPAILGEFKSAEAKGKIEVARPPVIPWTGLGGHSAGSTSFSGVFIDSGHSQPQRITAVPTGYVKFMDGETVLARVALDSNGTATWRPEVAESYNVRAVYEGDAAFLGSESEGLSIASTLTPVAVMLTVPESVRQGSAFRLSVKVTTTVLDVVAPTGLVDLYIGKRKIVTLELGKMAKGLKIKMRVGMNKIRAVYRGDGFCAGAGTSAKIVVSKPVEIVARSEGR